MRNKYEGICYKCGKTVEVGRGHFERIKYGTAKWKAGQRWRVQHVEHARKLSKVESPQGEK